MGEVLRCSGGNWKLYATVSGSALAMATNAAANVVYSGIQDISTAPPLATENYPGSEKTAAVKLTGGPSFKIGVTQFATDFWNGAAFVNGGGKVNFLRTSKSTHFLERLGPGALVSAKAGIFGGFPFGTGVGKQNVGSFLTVTSKGGDWPRWLSTTSPAGRPVTRDLQAFPSPTGSKRTTAGCGWNFLKAGSTWPMR